MKKRFLCILLALCMVLMLVPQAAFAAEPALVESIAVTVDEPVIGETPDNTPDYIITTSEGSVQQGWTLITKWCKISEDAYTGTNEDIWTEMTANEEFQEGYYYYVGIAFENKENYPFTTGTTATVNGKPHVNTYIPVYQEGDAGASVCGIFEPLNHVSFEAELRAANNADITKISKITLKENLTINELLSIGSGKTLTIPKGVTLTIQDAALVIGQDAVLIIQQGAALTIQNAVLGIQQDAVLMIQQGATLTIEGGLDIYSGGKIYVDEKVGGMLQGRSTYYLLNVENASASVEPAENLSEYKGKTYVRAGSDSEESSTITLTANNPAGQLFDHWDASPSTVVIDNNSFTMPAEPVTITARWKECTHPGELTHTPAVPATYSEYGVKEYWTCSTCNMHFSDAAGTSNFADLDAWKTGEGRIDKLILPVIDKTDTVAPDKDGNVVVTIDKSNVTTDGKTEVTVNESVADTILEQVASSESKKVIIDATTAKNTASEPVVAEPGYSTEVKLPEEAVKKLAEMEDVEITLVTDNGKVVLNQETVAAVAAKAGNDGQVTLVIETVEQNKNVLKIELKLQTSNGNVTDFNQGNVAVTVAVPKDMAEKKVVCVFIDENGKMSKVKGQKNADGTFTFFTGHFSTYAIMAEEEADTAIAAQKEETLAALADQQLTARSKIVTMKNGKKAVKITWCNEDGKRMDFDGVEIYRSTRRNAGYGKTPIFTTEKDAYYNTAIQKGTKYYYKVRGYVVIDGQKYYTDYSRKAIRTVK